MIDRLESRKQNAFHRLSQVKAPERTAGDQTKPVSNRGQSNATDYMVAHVESICTHF